MPGACPDAAPAPGGAGGSPCLCCGTVAWLALSWPSVPAFRLPGFSLQTYSQLAHPIQQAKALGLQFHSRILDIDNIDVSVPSGGRGRPRGCEGVLIRMALSREE